MAIKFKEIKQYISRTVRISICFLDGHYDNYIMISDIDEQYDDLYVYGVGMTQVEFPQDVYTRPFVSLGQVSYKEWMLGFGMEIVLDDEPREITRQDMSILRFRDLRPYIQSGMNFSVVFKENWSSESYKWKAEIPEKYDDLYVFGIGMEDMPKQLFKSRYPEFSEPQSSKNIELSIIGKQMVLVLATTPRIDIGVPDDI